MSSSDRGTTAKRPWWFWVVLAVALAALADALFEWADFLG
jgi:hypothetical protein